MIFTLVYGNPLVPYIWTKNNRDSFFVSIDSLARAALADAGTIDRKQQCRCNRRPLLSDSNLSNLVERSQAVVSLELGPQVDHVTGCDILP